MFITYIILLDLKKNRFKNEDSAQELHGKKRFIKYPILFNGDNVIPNLFVNFMGLFNDQIVFTEFNSKQAKEFLIFLMETAIKLQYFSHKSLKFGKVIGYPLRFCEITKDNIRIEKIQKI